MRQFGLIGFPLKHSFSKKYFTEKFARELIPDCAYELFELPYFNDLPALIASQPNLVGLNVTIPHKQNVIPFLDALDPASAGRIGAVNTICIQTDGKRVGYNTDYYGFKTSLENWLMQLGLTPGSLRALILGSGGASKAVEVALADLQIEYQIVSRQASDSRLSYAQLSEAVLDAHRLIINTSPVGTFPNVDDCPALSYHLLKSQHLLYDLVYNPAQTMFMQKGLLQGAKVQNGLAMLHLQAEKAWEIWNQE